MMSLLGEHVMAIPALIHYAGCLVGYLVGHLGGYLVGYHVGSVMEYLVGYRVGYLAGYLVGHCVGYLVGHRVGWFVGYSAGYSAGYFVVLAVFKLADMTGRINEWISSRILAEEENEGNDDDDSEVSVDGCCPICTRPYSPPRRNIFACRNGHSFCSECNANPALNHCPMCRLDLVNNPPIRNRLAEQLIRRCYGVDGGEVATVRARPAAINALKREE